VRWLAVAYAVAFGIAELVGLPLRAPSSSWQVPPTLVRGRPGWAKTLTWGVFLGPGLLTRNPYASIWMLPLLLAGVGSPAVGAAAGALVGLLQGSARAVGVLGEQRTADTGEYYLMVIRDMRWRRLDGADLLAVAVTVALGRFVGAA
jgi:hypothetical protein